MSETISISGQVQGYDGMPIFNIKVSAYHDLKHVDHVFTNKKGKYQLSIPSGPPITVRFDTHWSRADAEAEEWHPSVVANIDTKQDIELNRFLMRIRTTEGMAAELDALTAYQFCAMWTDREEPEFVRGYAKTAAVRLSQMKQSLRELDEFRVKLQEFFLKNLNLPDYG